MTDSSLTEFIRPLRRGQLTIPAEFRRRLGIDDDTLLQLTLREDKIEITPVVTRPAAGKAWARELYTMFTPVREEARALDESEIDTLIERFSKNWKIHRMSCVDRNVMRIAVYELLYCEDIPPKVSINEAVDVGKKFGTEESGAFINGIMDSIRDALVNEGKLKKIATQVENEMG